MRYPRPAPRERALLYTLWTVILLSASIFWFWPRLTAKSIPKIQVQIAPELQVWFSEGQLKAVVSQGLAVELKFQDKPLDSLSQIKTVHLGYDFGREKEVLFRGTLIWNPEASVEKNANRRISNTDRRLQLLLPNPNATHPAWIRLYFADSR